MNWVATFKLRGNGTMVLRWPSGKELIGLGWWMRIKTQADCPSPLEHVISLNIMRRRLNSEQKRNLIAELLKDAPDRSDRDTARIIGVDGKTVGTVRHKLESTGRSPWSPRLGGATGASAARSVLRRGRPPGRVPRERSIVIAKT
jgi:hypothetical protein